jgi:hypothetical protein
VMQARRAEWQRPKVAQRLKLSRRLRRRSTIVVVDAGLTG